MKNGFEVINDGTTSILLLSLSLESFSLKVGVVGMQK
jgi:hypothetical protein